MRFHNPNAQWFNPIVWDIVRQIGEGEVATYGQIAGMIPAPPDMDEMSFRRIAPRWVGDALNGVSESDDPSIPWHRVINAKGGISLPEGSATATTQRQRLMAESVAFDAQGLVDLRVYGWNGADDAYLQAHQLYPARMLRPADKPDNGQISLF